ncbi:MAG: SPOR domain-containing protein [Lysobacterales bacterium]|nr:MAG: SPOR domain-containing protein [Xanthomonadales bacterium]
MDESLKARLIGAAVLVALAVLLIPELLSGRRSETAPTVVEDDARATRSFTIELGGASAGTSRGEVAPAAQPPEAPAGKPVPAQDRAQPALADPVVDPVEPSPASEGTAPEPLPLETRPAQPSPEAARAPSPEDAADAAPAPEPVRAAPARGGWAVQVGAFGSAAAAGKLVAQLERDGFRAYVAPVKRDGKTLHRVRVGPEPDRSAADRLAQRLKSRGLPASVVAND